MLVLEVTLLYSLPPFFIIMSHRQLTRGMNVTGMVSALNFHVGSSCYMPAAAWPHIHSNPFQILTNFQVGPNFSFRQIFGLVHVFSVVVV